MPITRSDLRKQYEQFNATATDSLVKRMFDTICDEITISNSYGSTKCCVELKYKSAYWTQPLVDRVVNMLKNHYTDSYIYTYDKAITIDWTLSDSPDLGTERSEAEFLTNSLERSRGEVVNNDSETNEPLVTVKTSQVDSDEKNDNIQINISLPSRVSTRSSSRK